MKGIPKKLYQFRNSKVIQIKHILFSDEGTFTLLDMVIVTIVVTGLQIILIGWEKNIHNILKRYMCRQRLLTTLSLLPLSMMEILMEIFILKCSKIMSYQFWQKKNTAILPYQCMAASRPNISKSDIREDLTLLRFFVTRHIM